MEKEHDQLKLEIAKGGRAWGAHAPEQESLGTTKYSAQVPFELGLGAFEGKVPAEMQTFWPETEDSAIGGCKTFT